MTYLHVSEKILKFYNTKKKKKEEEDLSTKH